MAARGRITWHVQVEWCSATASSRGAAVLAAVRSRRAAHQAVAPQRNLQHIHIIVAQPQRPAPHTAAGGTAVGLKCGGLCNSHAGETRRPTGRAPQCAQRAAPATAPPPAPMPAHLWGWKMGGRPGASSLAMASSSLLRNICCWNRLFSECRRHCCSCCRSCTGRVGWGHGAVGRARGGGGRGGERRQWAAGPPGGLWTAGSALQWPQHHPVIRCAGLQRQATPGRGRSISPGLTW